MTKVQGRTAAAPTRSLAYGKAQIGDAQVVRLLPPLCPTTSFPAEVLLEVMEWAKVDTAVLLQGPIDGDANEYAASAVRRWSDRFIGAGFLDPCAAQAGDRFRHITEELGLRILKFEFTESLGFPGPYPDFSLDSAMMEWMWAEAEEQGILVTLDLCPMDSKSYQTEVVGNVLDAMSVPGQGIEDYPYRIACQYIRRAVEMVGPEKLLWGADVPGLVIIATYPQLLHFVTRHCDFLSRDALDKMLGHNA